MKKTILSLMLSVVTMTTFAQAKVMFRVQAPDSPEISEQVAKNLTTKIRTAMTRNSAAAAGDMDVFVIEPTITITDMDSSSGTMQTITACYGELTLVAMNQCDGAEYHSVTIPVKGTVVGDKEKAMLDMIANIRPVDPAFTKFVRIAREKIQTHYSNNCAAIVTKAQTLFDSGEYETCVSYLSAISEVLPCYDQASAILVEANKRINGEPVVIEKEVEKVIVKEVPVEKVVVKEVPVPVQAPKPAAPKPVGMDYEISMSNSDINFVIESIDTDWPAKSIYINAKVTNNRSDREQMQFHFAKIFTADGDNISNCAVTQKGNHLSYPNRDTPKDFALKHTFAISKLEKKVPEFAILEINIGSTVVTIKNMKVKW